MNRLLLEGLTQLQLTLTSTQVEQLLELQNQLLKWNQTFNLTAITDPSESLKLHLLDSLSIVKYWNFRSTIDVGTGAGFPGLPLAIALPDAQFTLLDSNSKKIRFIRQQIHQLGLQNVTAVHSRVEQYRQQTFDAVVSRAFASLLDMVSWTKHLLKPDGCWMAMKGVFDPDELSALPDDIVMKSVEKLAVPFVSAERCLIKLCQGND